MLQIGTFQKNEEKKNQTLFLGEKQCSYNFNMYIRWIIYQDCVWKEMAAPEQT